MCKRANFAYSLQDVRLYERRLARTLHSRHGGGCSYPYVSVFATVVDCHPTYPIKMSMAVRSILWLAVPPNRESARCTASCSPCPPPANGSGGWWSSEPALTPHTWYTIFPHSITIGNKNPDLYVSDPCMDLASCRHSTTAAGWARDVFEGQRVVYPLLDTSHKEAPRRGRVEATAAMAMVVE